MINLLPLEVRTERQYGRKNRILIGYVFALLITAMLVATVMLGSLRFFGTNEQELRNEVNENSLLITTLQIKTTEMNKTVEQLDIVNKLYENGISFSELVPEIGSILPEGTILNALSLTGESIGTLSLDVDLERPELAAVLVRNLVESDLFEAADIGNLNPKGNEGDRYRYGTVVKVSFEGTAEAKRRIEAAARAAAEATRAITESESTE